MKYAFAGDRAISTNILEFLIRRGYKPSVLFISKGKNESHASSLIKLADLSDDRIFYGNEFKNDLSMKVLNSLDLDYIFGIHFPYIIPKEILEIPNVGVVNLHPAYLPYNKGWHTPSWAILDGTPYGATLHFMEEELDAGDIIHQKKIDVDPADTANSLYKKTLKLEEEVFKESFKDLLSLKPPRINQRNKGTAYSKKDLEKVRELDLSTEVKVEDIINRLRALTTNSFNEAAYFEKNGKKYALQINIKEI